MKHQTIQIIIFSIVLLLTNSLKAQDKWSLEQCLQYALENNINIKQQMLNVRFNKNQKEQSKYNLAPSLNASVGQNYSFGRSKNVINNQYYDMNSSNTSFSASANVTLFNGLAKINQMKKSEYDWKASLKDLEKVKNDISLSIMSAYLDVLFNKELLAVAERQLEMINWQVKNNKNKVEAGNLAKGVLLETEAQQAQEELNVTNYKNRLNLSLINLAQLLDLKDVTNFQIETPNLDMSRVNENLLSASTIFAEAVNHRPEIQSKEWRLKSMEKANAIAKAQLYPSLSLGAYYNNDYQDFKGNSRSFSEQIKNNGKEGIGLSLRIPIFNGLSARYNVGNAKINYENSKYELELVKNNLLKEIQQSYANAVAAMQKYQSAEKAFKSSEEAFRYIDEKFRLGMVSALEYNTGKNKMNNARSSLIQAKYEYVFRVKMLDFYNGKPLSL